MGIQSRHNLSISGIGTSGGGTVHSARINGIGKVEGDLVCSDLVVNGKADVQGSIQASRAEINGTAAVGGVLHAGQLRIHGKLSTKGNLIGEHIEVSGAASVEGSCEAEKFRANGRLQIEMLNAGNIQIRLHGHSKVTEIGGEHIQIRRQPGIDFAKWLKMLPLPLGNRLTSQIIEGDYVYVEHTTAAVVRGSEVAVGPGCEIGLVEYKTKFEQDKGSAVKRTERI